MSNLNNWQRKLINPCACGCGVKVAKKFKKGHGRRRPVGARMAEMLVQSGDCIEWTGATSANGYGRIGIGGSRTAQVHRVAYEAARGPIPAGLHIDHLCRNRRCVNPDHLEPVTQSENNRRANALRWHGRGTTDPGDQHVLMTLRDLVALMTGQRPGGEGS
ncbi:HNH endonuclease signature motif containing protein [Isoptericola aurantiacus]|uniref:HNH endonuclease signature motif containing protein n=1 Tax=Isoptericola aurantiacus TaxID=3377839 RepID=UPI003839EAF0